MFIFIKNHAKTEWYYIHLSIHLSILVQKAFVLLYTVFNLQKY